MTTHLVITGYPRSGKTTLAQALHDTDLDVIHTDSLMNMDWSRQSEVVSSWFDSPKPWVIEGTTCVRAIRKWLSMNPGTDFPWPVVFLRQAWEPLSPGQQSMCKALDTIWSEICISVHEIDHSEIVEVISE